ncbi:MAG TPA: hypothetical protein VF592_00365 [Sphingomonas sp.]|jgi:hypothetical protein|uniref:hypothetical protein n=1 Tax=Sphingomonas sp. TaxID=28214 RepID=UPI002ED82E20
MTVQDRFLTISRCQEIVDSPWSGKNDKVTPMLGKQLLDAEQMLVEQRVSRTGGRDRLLNFYSIRDHMVRCYRVVGPRGLPDLDAARARL